MNLIKDRRKFILEEYCSSIIRDFDYSNLIIISSLSNHKNHVDSFYIHSVANLLESKGFQVEQIGETEAYRIIYHEVI
jgi:hypothetical protein